MNSGREYICVATIRGETFRAYSPGFPLHRKHNSFVCNPILEEKNEHKEWLRNCAPNRSILNYNFTSLTNETLYAAWAQAGPVGQSTQVWHPVSSPLYLASTVAQEPFCAYLVPDSTLIWRLATMACLSGYDRFQAVICEQNKSSGMTRWLTPQEVYTNQYSYLGSKSCRWVATKKAGPQEV